MFNNVVDAVKLKMVLLFFVGMVVEDATNGVVGDRGGILGSLWFSDTSSSSRCSCRLSARCKVLA